MKNRYMVSVILFVGFLTYCTPPTLKPPLDTRDVWLEQNWDETLRDWFHHETQGTATLQIPYEWFMALEAPEFGISGNPRLFSDSGYLSGFGLIPDEKNLYNPDGLPIGIAVTSGYENPINVPRFSNEYRAIGFTCAACHTGQFTYEGTRVLIDGGAAMADVVRLEKAIGFALFYTLQVPGRFSRFAERVLGDKHNPRTEQELFDEVSANMAYQRWILELNNNYAEQNVVEGYGRIDALNRIANQVFGTNPEIASNYGPITAPVSLPHIWMTPWFNWVQYDGSVRQPMIRNAGEALGVVAPGKFTEGPGRYSSTVEFERIHQMVSVLAGAPPYKNKKFTGLVAPRWPEHILPPIQREQAERGKALYDMHCKKCHGPEVGSDEFWSSEWWVEAPENSDIKLFRQRFSLLDEIGTDPAQSSVVMSRTVDTTKLLSPDDRLCVNVSGPDENGVIREEFVNIPVPAGPEQSFALSLGVIVEKSVNYWYDREKLDTHTRWEYSGRRGNCLQAFPMYKARPLDGIWATAPFLHNGSVPTLYHLLSPHEERPQVFYVGNFEFNPRKVGYRTKRVEGAMRFDTTIPGNLNTGHEFADKPGQPGVIGPLLSEKERYDLIEYLKTM